VAFYTGNSDGEYGRSVEASSIFLTAASANQANTINWQEQTPWENYQYEIFLVDRNGIILDELGLIVDQPFVHTGLVNGEEYCYMVESKGTYGLADIRSPLFNKSQITCAIPLDTIPPCPPELEVENICSRIDQVTDPSDVDLKNYLSWNIPFCEDGDPNETVETFLVFFSASESEELELIAELDGNVTEYEHQPPFGVTGCYAIQAVDSSGNISEFSNLVCKSNCPVYNLPNAFTPNGDGFNDLFVPFEPFLFVERVDFEIFNRWGQKVFETEDPEINWDGTNLRGEDLNEGTYHYRATVFFRTTADTESAQVINGFIQLLR
jgi:gliding motility-associated-like protein